MQVSAVGIGTSQIARNVVRLRRNCKLQFSACRFTSMFHAPSVTVKLLLPVQTVWLSIKLIVASSKCLTLEQVYCRFKLFDFRSNVSWPVQTVWISIKIVGVLPVQIVWRSIKRIAASSNCLTFDQTYCSECVKSELILETRVQEAGAAEPLEIGKSETGASNKSGRCCMRAIEEKWYDVVVSLWWVLVECYPGALSVSNPCSFWRHGFRKQVLLSRWK